MRKSLHQRWSVAAFPRKNRVTHPSIIFTPALPPLWLLPTVICTLLGQDGMWRLGSGVSFCSISLPLFIKCSLTKPSAFLIAGFSRSPHPAKASGDFTQRLRGISPLRLLKVCLSWFSHIHSEGIFLLSSSRWRGHSLLNQSWHTVHNSVQSQPQVRNCAAINERFGARQNVWHLKFSALLPQKGNLWLLDPP